MKRRIHVVYTKKKGKWFCGEDYVAKDLASLHPTVLFDIASDAALLLAAELASRDVTIDVIVAPALGAISFGTLVAYHLSLLLGKEVLFVAAEKIKDKETGENEFSPRLPDQLEGKNVVVVEDVANSGESAAKVVRAVRAVGGNVVAVLVIWNRGENVTEKEVGDVPLLVSLVNVKLPIYPIRTCPACQAGKPFDQHPGKRDEYLAEQEAAEAELAKAISDSG